MFFKSSEKVAIGLERRRPAFPYTFIFNADAIRSAPGSFPFQYNEGLGV